MGKEKGAGKRWQQGSSEPCVLLPSGTWISGWPWGPPRGCHLGGALLHPLSTKSDPSFVTCVALPAFRGLFHVPLVR